MEACELLALELRLDRIEAELAGELPPHLRQFARAYAAGAASRSSARPRSASTGCARVALAVSSEVGRSSTSGTRGGCAPAT